MNALQQDNSNRSNQESTADLMEALCGSDELDIFNSEAVCTMIDYKWAKYGFRSHFYGCIFHICYITVLVRFICKTYLISKADLPKDTVHTAEPYYMCLMGFFLIYPLCYDGI